MWSQFFNATHNLLEKVEDVVEEETRAIGRFIAKERIFLDHLDDNVEGGCRHRSVEKHNDRCVSTHIRMTYLHTYSLVEENKTDVDGRWESITGYCPVYNWSTFWSMCCLDAYITR